MSDQRRPPRRPLLGQGAALLALATLLHPSAAGAAPATGGAIPPPLQAATGAGRWSTPGPALQAYLHRGELRDRSLAVLVRRSGWEAEELRRALVKPYSVDLVRLDRSLGREPALSLLSASSASYSPAAAPNQAAAALRAAILADAADGTLSAAGILSQLPISFRLARIPPQASGSLTPCRPQPDNRRGSSLLSWYSFLPACLQAWSYGPAGDLSSARAAEPRP